MEAEKAGLAWHQLSFDINKQIRGKPGKYSREIQEKQNAHVQNLLKLIKECWGKAATKNKEGGRRATDEIMNKIV